MTKYKSKWLDNRNISIIDNYLSQNRYGLAGEDINIFTVKNNIFIQKFNNNAARQRGPE